MSLISGAFMKAVLICLIVICLLASVPACTTEELLSSNDTAPYAIVCSSSPGGGLSQSYGISKIDLDTYEARTYYDGQSPLVGVIASLDGKRIYAINEMGASVTVLNASDHSVLKIIKAGMFPQDAVISLDGSRLYVSSAQAYYGNMITVIDTSTDEVIATIKANISPGKMAITPDGSRIFVAQPFYDSEASNDVGIVDTKNYTMAGKLDAGPHPVSVVVSPDGSRLYVASQVMGTITAFNVTTGAKTGAVILGRSPLDIGLNDDGSIAYVINDYYDRCYLSIIDTRSMTVSSKIELPSIMPEEYYDSTPRRLAVRADGSEVYVTSPGTGGIMIVNTMTGSISAIDTGANPSGLTLTPGGLLYVANKGSGSISIIDTSDDLMIDAIRYSISPAFVAIAPDGSRAYVTNPEIGEVMVLNASTMDTIARINSSGFHVAVSPDGKRVYTTEKNTIAVIDVYSDKVLDRWNMESFTADLTPSRDGAFLYATHTRKGSDNTYYDVYKINTSTGNVISNYQLGRFAGSMAISPDGKWLYACLWESNTVVVMDTSDGRIVARVETARSPESIQVSSDGKLAYAACNGAKKIAIIDTQNNRVAGEIDISIHPGQISISPDGTTACLAGSDGIAIVDLANKRVVKTITIMDSRGVAINPAMGESKSGWAGDVDGQ
jgi:YVTN family beta-propeller protein